MANNLSNSSANASSRKIPIKRFKLNIKKSKPRPLKKKGSNDHFLIEVNGLPDKYPTPPEILIQHITRSAIQRFVERDDCSIDVPSDRFQKGLFQRLPYYADTNSWMVFRSFFSTGITYEITSQNNLSSILSASWKSDSSIREQWGILHQFYHSFRTTEPEFNISFQMWLNLKYKMPKDYLVVHKEVCDKVFSVFEIPNFLKKNEKQNYFIPDNLEIENKLFSVIDYILERIVSKENLTVSFERALKKLDDQISEASLFSKLDN